VEELEGEEEWKVRKSLKVRKSWKSVIELPRPCGSAIDPKYGIANLKCALFCKAHLR